jgi:hypothetical protein
MSPALDTPQFVSGPSAISPLVWSLPAGSLTHSLDNCQSKSPRQVALLCPLNLASCLLEAGVGVAVVAPPWS